MLRPVVLSLSALFVTAALAACDGGGGASGPTTAAATPRATPTATRSTVSAPVVDVCTELPVEVVSYLLGVTVDSGAPAQPAGTLLGECDYTRSEAGGYQHIYIAARDATTFDTFLSDYGTVRLTIGGQKAAYSAKAGLLMRVPKSDYFLQIAVQGTDGGMLLTPAQRLAEYYIGV